MENENVNKVEEQNQPKWKKVVSIIINVIFYSFIAFLLVFAVAAFSSNNNDRKIANIFGIGFLNVVSDSMDGNRKDSFKEGDLLFVKVCNSERTQLEGVEAQEDIITFWDSSIGNNGALSTHRIVDIIENADGTIIYRTQGDKIESNYPEYVYDAETKSPTTYTEDHYSYQIYAVYTGHKIAGFGKVLNFINSTPGFLLCVILPGILLLAYEVFNLIRNLNAMNKQKMQAEYESNKFDAEAEKERIRQELLREMQAEKEKAENKELDDASEDDASGDAVEEAPQEDKKEEE